jgi:hypothetical protein
MMDKRDDWQQSWVGYFLVVTTTVIVLLLVVLVLWRVGMLK